MARLNAVDLARERKNRAGCVYLSYSRRTGALRGVYLADEQGLDTDSGKWTTVCEDHGTLVQTDTRSHAIASDTDDFCDECRDRRKP